MADLEDGPDVVPIVLDERGQRLRSLLHQDLDKCHCKVEIFDKGHSSFLCVGRDNVEIFDSPNFCRVAVPLRPEPVVAKDIEALFIEAALRADTTPLWQRDQVEKARLVPENSGLDGIEVPGLPGPIAVAEPLMLGQYIQNYSNFGAFIILESVQRIHA